MAPDLAAALDARPGARATWDAYLRSVERQHLERLVQAKRPETRAKRLAATAGRGERGD